VNLSIVFSSGIVRKKRSPLPEAVLIERTIPVLSNRRIGQSSEGQWVMAVMIAKKSIIC